MTTTNTILGGIAVGMTVWFIQQIISHYKKKNRIERAIVVDINYHLLGVNEAKIFLSKLFDDKINPSKTIEYVAHFTRDEYELYKSIQSEFFEFFNKSDIEKITKFYKAFWELEVLFEGLMLDLMEWKKEKRILSNDDVSYLKLKRERIDSLALLLTQDPINKIADLPSDYSNRKSPDTIIK